MQNILAIIDLENISEKIIEKSSLIFNSKTIWQNHYELVNSSKFIKNILFNSNYLNQVPIPFQKKELSEKIIFNEKLNNYCSCNEKSILRVIKILEKDGYFFDSILYLRSDYPALSIFAVEDAIKYFYKNADSTSLRTVEKLLLKTSDCSTISNENPNEILQLNFSKNKFKENQTIYAHTDAFFIFNVEALKKGNLWGDKCLKYEFGSYKARLKNYSNIPEIYGHLDEISTIEKIKNNIPTEICFDIDGVLFSRDLDNNYNNGIPNQIAINFLKKLFSKGHKIIIHTARGSKTKINWEKETKAQLKKYSIPYHQISFGKPGSDFYIDDKSISLIKLMNIFKKNLSE